VISRLVKQPLDDAMIALVLLTRSQLRVDPIQLSSRAASSEVSDPIVTIDTSKMTFVLEGSKKTTSASKVLPSAAVRRVSTTAASVTPF